MSMRPPRICAHCGKSYRRLGVGRGCSQMCQFLLGVGDRGAGCWLWKRSLGVWGYGQTNLVGLPPKAHRASWVLHYGPIPAGLCVLHRCDTPACVRPDHLFLGTHADNVADRDAKGRTGHSMGRSGEKNAMSKLTAREVRAIYRRANAGEVQDSLATEFGVSATCVSKIVRRTRWKEVLEEVR